MLLPVAVAKTKSSRRRTNQRAERRLSLTSTETVREPFVIPTRWLNTGIGVFLLPVAWIFSQTFFYAFSRATLEHGLWASEEFWFFALGATLWVLWFFGSIWALGEPRPLRAYVFGHELTHAVWVWLMGGRVTAFKVEREGGYILTDKHNFFIALAPYFYPIYSLAVILIYGGLSIFYDCIHGNVTFAGMTSIQWLFLILGATWSFHMSFTCWMIPKGQSDLTYHGVFFSLVIIYIMNLLVLSLVLIVSAPEIGWGSYARELLGNAEDFSTAVWDIFEQLIHSVKSF